MNAADFQSIQLPEALRLLDETPAVLRAAIVDATAEQLRYRPAPDAFSLVEHACHLRDLESEGYNFRLRRMLGEENPTLAGFEGDVIARERDYLAQDAAHAAAQFAVSRAALVARAGTLTFAEMARAGTFMGRTITVCDLLAMMVEHDRGHREEIAVLVAMRQPR
ncbi:MAG TPA: DinB family protein [Usitatibacter sp.]|nr:DinB family protein [Usitatibacter sp.]